MQQSLALARRPQPAARRLAASPPRRPHLAAHRPQPAALPPAARSPQLAGSSRQTGTCNPERWVAEIVFAISPLKNYDLDGK